MKIIVAISGGIAAYKAPDIISGFKKYGYDVGGDYYISAIATDNALKFVTKSALKNTAHKVWEASTDSPVHIEASKDCDLFVIVPATANTIAKMAHGISDNIVVDTYLALKPNTIKVVCPAMNTRMWEHPTVMRNLSILEGDGCSIIDPVSGMLACGTVGIGKLPPTKDIVKKTIGIYNEKA